MVLHRNDSFQLLNYFNIVNEWSDVREVVG